MKLPPVDADALFLTSRGGNAGDYVPPSHPLLCRSERDHASLLYAYGRAEGRKCGDCARLVAHGKNRTVYKCSMARVSCSAATDWRKKWEACGKWKQP